MFKFRDKNLNLTLPSLLNSNKINSKLRKIDSVKISSVYNTYY